METFENLTKEEKEQILLVPVYISLLVANADGELDQNKKAIAIKLTHCKTFCCEPQLQEYYKEVEKQFAENVDHLDEIIPKSRPVRKRILDEELQKMVPVILKLGEELAEKLYKSLLSYNSHVNRVHWNVPNEPLNCLELEGLTVMN